MTTQQQARALMVRHHQTVKNRQQSLLERAAAEIGLEVDGDSWNTIQGKPQWGARKLYARSNATMS